MIKSHRILCVTLLISLVLKHGFATNQVLVSLDKTPKFVDNLSVGSTPSSRYAAKVDGVTEIHPGTYVFGDLMQVSMGAHRRLSMIW